MKIRNGFISNSSSSSFIVSLNDITSKEVEILLDYPNHSSSYDFNNNDYDYHDWWHIEVDRQNNQINGFTSMDNDYLWKYLKDNGIDIRKFNVNAD